MKQLSHITALDKESHITD